MGKNIELFEGIRSGIFMIRGVMDHSKYLLVLAIFFISINSIGQTYDQGALIRSNTEKSLIYLIFTGDEFGDGSKIISKTLKKHNVKAHFFFTGNFYRNAAFENSIKKLKKEGHYLGAHSDRHLLYVSWEKRDSTLISEEEFKDDITGNYDEMSRFEIAKEDAMYFMPPFEWYNQEIADWTKALGLVLINHTPGTRSAADYTTPAMVPGYVDSPTIIKSILEYESMEKKGLNGFHLLVHFGSDPQRMDKLYYRLDQLIVELKYRGYEFGLLTDQ